jgi:Zn-dependent membrane protease YugP
MNLLPGSEALAFIVWNWHYMLYVALPLLVLTMVVQGWVKSAYAKYSRIPNSSGITGAEAAMGILRANGVSDVRVEVTRGWLSDHYDPRNKVLRLSPDNYSGRSIAAVGIAAHEAGHAIQHARAFAPLTLRNLAVPMASLGSGFGYLVIIIGIFMSGSAGLVNPLTMIGLGLIAAVAVFQLVNLPVEFDASRRALQVLPQMGILGAEETAGARKMLTAAAMTYVAATVAALVELLYFALLIFGSRE